MTAPRMILPALTVCQPYAELIASGAKPIENRRWAPSYRGPLLIHAGKSLAWLDQPSDKDRFVLGAVVAVGRLVACLPKGFGSRAEQDRWGRWAHLFHHEHAFGTWCLVLEDVRRVPAPIPCRGAQGLWYPGEAITRRAIEESGFALNPTEVAP